MLKDLIKLANHLDSMGLNKEADIVDKIIKRSKETGADFSDFDFNNIKNYDTEIDYELEKDEGPKEFGVGFYIEESVFDDTGRLVMKISGVGIFGILPMSKRSVIRYIDSAKRNIIDSNIPKVDVFDNVTEGDKEEHAFKSRLNLNYGAVDVRMFVAEIEELKEDGYTNFEPSDIRSLLNLLINNYNNGEDHVIPYFEAITNTLER